MTKTEKMQHLHHLSATGEILTNEEQAALDRWYQTLDREEAIINAGNRLVEIKALRETVAERAARIAVVGEEVTAMLKQNEILRRENVGLRRLLEARLTEQQKIEA